MTTPERQANRAAFLDRYALVSLLWHQTAEDGSDVRVYPNGPRHFVVLAFLGTAGKPAVYVSYRTREDATAAAHQVLAGRLAHCERVTTARQERRAFQTSLQVGSVLMDSWGYDETNIDYYQVIAVSASRQSVTIRKIGARHVEDGFMQGSCWPLADHFIGPEMVKRVQPGESVKVKDWGSWAHPWTPKADRWTAYA